MQTPTTLYNPRFACVLNCMRVCGLVMRQQYGVLYRVGLSKGVERTFSCQQNCSYFLILVSSSQVYAVGLVAICRLVTKIT